MAPTMRHPKARTKQPTTPQNSSETRIRGTAYARDRQGEIHKLLYQQWKNPPEDGKYLNTTQLSKTFKVGASTIDRDIAEMRDRRGLPITTIRGGRGGHYYTEEVVEFPGLQFSEGELYMLVQAVR